MYEPLILATAILLGILLLRLLRPGSGVPVPYALLLALQLALAIAGYGPEVKPVGVNAIALCVLTVLVPALLEGIARQLFARGRTRVAVALAGLRAILMPGTGLGRHHEILRGIALLERDGVDAALGHFRGLLEATEDPREIALIREQIVTVFLYLHRWSEAITYVESQLPIAFVLLRPALALGLLRAYGEVGNLASAAGLLRLIESTPVTTGPLADDIIRQAQLTFLAYAGEAGHVERAVGKPELFGLSPVHGALFHGIALARAGERERALAALDRVRSLAGPRDHRTLEVAKSMRQRLHDAEAAVEVGPELRTYAASVGERLQGFIADGGVRSPNRRPLATYALVSLMVAGYLGWLVGGGGGGLGLLEAGVLTPGLWRAGSWGRLFTAPWIHGDLIALLIDAYSVWLAGHVLERQLGGARMLVIGGVGGLAGLALAVSTTPEPMALVAGGPALAVALVVGALWTLVSRIRPIPLGKRPRRALIWTLLFLLGAQVLACLPTAHGLQVAPIALAGAALVATLLVTLLAAKDGPWVSRIAAGVAGLLAVVGVAGGLQVHADDVEGYLLAHREVEVTIDGVRLALPPGFGLKAAGSSPQGSPIPGYGGVVDGIARRGGAWVEFAVVRGELGAPTAGPALLALDPGLTREASLLVDRQPPQAVSEALGAVDGDWRAYLLSRNGATVARVIERRLPASAATVLVIAAPPRALADAAGLYAAILGDAVDVGGESGG